MYSHYRVVLETNEKTYAQEEIELEKSPRY